MAVKDFPEWIRDAAFESDAVQNLLLSIFRRQNIDAQQELTSVASGDELYVFDVSETGQVKTKKLTAGNLVGGGLAGSFSTITATGLVDISASGAGQIKFPATQNPSSNANTLDDYEEGTFTLTVASSGGGAATYSNQTGFYTMFGNRVLVNGRLVLATLGTLAAGTLTIEGFPVASNSATGNFSTLAVSPNSLAATAVDAVSATLINNVTNAAVQRYAAGTTTNITVAEITGTAVFNFGGQYFR